MLFTVSSAPPFTWDCACVSTVLAAPQATATSCGIDCATDVACCTCAAVQAATASATERPIAIERRRNDDFIALLLAWVEREGEPPGSAPDRDPGAAAA